MIIRSIHIKEGLSERTVSFSKKVNLVHSEKNSKGKTTLLRMILYSLGYNVPSTKRIKFNRCEVTIKLLCESHGDVTLQRFSNDFIVAVVNNSKITFVLPDQLNNLHKLIYGTENEEILANILGSFYIDQEKGWTLLNRGIAIGSIHFNIEALIRGLSGRDCSELIAEEARLSAELEKYQQMLSIARYQETIASKSKLLVYESSVESSEAELNQLVLQKNSLKAELRRLDSTLSDNKRFRSFIAKMKILIKTSRGETVPVTEDNIVGLNDSIELLVAKRKIIAAEYADIVQIINRLNKAKVADEDQLAFFQSDDLVQMFDREISSFPIDVKLVNKKIYTLKSSLRDIRDKITSKTKRNNPIVLSLYKNVVKYASELGIGDESTIAANYLFTSNLKELSGAILHKTVFAFRLAYIIEIEKALKIKLPIILDSPSGKEIDQNNIQLMVNILSRDFTRNQIIIASIFKYDFIDIKLIEIMDHLIE